jgi:hypothetical protein
MLGGANVRKPKPNSIVGQYYMSPYSQHVKNDLFSLVGEYT